MRLFLDPGVTTGWALLDGKGDVKDYGQIKGVDGVTNLLIMTHRETPLEEIFFEPFLIDNDKIFRDHTGGRRKTFLSHIEKIAIQTTLEVIGAVKAFCSIFKIVLQEIKNVALQAAYAISGLTMLPKSQHAESHQYDALAYAMHYAIKNGLIKPQRRHT